MATPFTPEQRAKIIASIKDDGMSIADVSKTYEVSENTLKKWVRETYGMAQVHAGNNELHRLRRDIAILKEILANLLIERELARKSVARA